MKKFLNQLSFNAIYKIALDSGISITRQSGEKVSLSVIIDQIASYYKSYNLNAADLRSRYPDIYDIK